jgi:hypothetical protein
MGSRCPKSLPIFYRVSQHSALFAEAVPLSAALIERIIRFV